MIKLDVRGLDSAMRNLQGAASRLPDAIARAMNRAVDQAATQVGRTLAEESGLGVRRTREAMVIERASARKLTVAITVQGKAAPLSEFAPRQTREGVSARPWGQRLELTQLS